MKILLTLLVGLALIALAVRLAVVIARKIAADDGYDPDDGSAR